MTMQHSGRGVGENAGGGNATNEIDASEAQARAGFYGLLARALAKPMDGPTLDFMRTLATHEGGTPIGDSLKAFGTLCSRTPESKAEEEYTVLFLWLRCGRRFKPIRIVLFDGHVL